MVDLEICDYLLNIPNIEHFILCNIGDSDIWIDNDFGVTLHVPVLSVRYKQPVQTITPGMQRTTFMSCEVIPKNLQETLINFIYPYIIPEPAERIIDSRKGNVPENICHYLAYTIDQEELLLIRRKMLIDEALLEL